MPTFEINTVGLDKHVEDTLRAEVKKLKEENASLKESNDELESEVLDSRESYNLQQMSENFWYKGEEFTDPETDETLSHSDYFDLLKECYDKNIKLEELKEENKKLKGQVEKNLERNRDLKDFRSVCDSLSLPELTDDCLMEYINDKNTENKKLKKEKESLALLVKGSDSLDGSRRQCIKEYRTQIEELTERVTDLQNVSRTYKKELDLEHTRYVKSKEELYETIMELKNPVTNYDERCGVVRVRCNHAYLMAFMSRYDITDSPDNIDEAEEFDGVLEHMSKEVENVIDTYLQDSLIYGTHMTLNEVIREKLDDIIDQAIDDGIVKEIDDSSDED